MPKPFERVPFEELPELPRVPHAFFDAPERRVDTWTEGLGDVETSVRVLGSGPPLILLHGLMTTGYSWRYVLAPLAERYTVIVPDLPGVGRSSAPDGRYTPAAISDWLWALQQRLGVVGCRLVGNSMGGYLATHHVLRRPGAVSRLVVAHAPFVADPRLLALAAVIRAPGAEGGLRALVARDPERWAWRNVHYWDETLKSREETREYGPPLVTPGGARGFHRYLRDAMAPGPMRALARSLEQRRDAGCDFPVPLLLVYARQDPMVPARHGERMAERVPDAGYRWLDHASHFAHIDAVDAYLDAVRPFLEKGPH